MNKIRVIIFITCTVLLFRTNAQQIINLVQNIDTVRVLNNPHKGWYHHFYANQIDTYGKIGQDVSIIPNLEYLYIRLAWSFFEPEDDVYDWSLIDDVVNYYWPRGYKVAICITSKETGTKDWKVVGQNVDNINYATPKWVRDLGARGYVVENWGNLHWEPEYSDSVFIEKVNDFHKALSTRYDGKPYIQYVDVCSIGEWGEGHTGFSSGITPSVSTVKSHIDVYDKYYKNTPVAVNDDYIYWNKTDKQAEILKNYIESKNFWLQDWSIMVEWWAKEGAKNTWGVHKPDLFKDNYLNTPVIIECHHYKDLINWGMWCKPNGEDCGKYGASWLLKDIELMHATYISFQGWPQNYMNDNPEFAKYVANKVGYWYYPISFKFPSKINQGESISVEAAWFNAGVAPAYNKYNVILKLEGAETIEKTLIESDNLTWMPNEITTENYQLIIPENVTDDFYKVKIKLIDELNPERVIDLALKEELKDKDGFFEIGKVGIGNISTVSFIQHRNNQIKIYPQPARDKFMIEGAQNLVSVSMFNLKGQKIEIHQKGNNPMVYHLNDAEKGLYFVRLEEKETTCIKKLIIY